MVFSGKNKDFKKFLNRLKRQYGEKAKLKDVEEEEKLRDMLMCVKCGNTIDEEDLGHYHECHGHDGLAPIREKMTNWNCSCGGELREARYCHVCEDYFLPDDDEPSSLMYVCYDCMAEYEKTKIALAMGEKDLMPVKINGFIDHCLTEKQINEILTKYILDNISDDNSKVKTYCNQDHDFFGEHILKIEGKEIG